MILSTAGTDCWRPRQENFNPTVAFQFNEDRQSVEKKKSSFAGVGQVKKSINLYFHQYIYIYIYNIHIYHYLKAVLFHAKRFLFYLWCAFIDVMRGDYDF